MEAVCRTRPPAILSALRALRVSTVGSVVICSGQQSVAEAAGGTKVLTRDLFATYFARTHDRKSSGRKLLLQCENWSTASKQVGHRQEWLVSRQALRARQSENAQSHPVNGSVPTCHYIQPTTHTAGVLHSSLQACCTYMRVPRLFAFLKAFPRDSGRPLPLSPHGQGRWERHGTR